MINTIVSGVPVNGFDNHTKYKFAVRTFFLSVKDIYVTDVYYLREEEYYKNINVIIPADTKEDIFLQKDFSTRYPLDWICNHRDFLNEGRRDTYNSSLRKLGEHHLKVCTDIINGEYWLGAIAIP